MARERMVTRTIEFAKVNAMVCNTVTASVDNVELVLTSPTDNTEKYFIKELNKLVVNDDVVVVKINSVEYSTAIYGMSENEFLQHARIIDR